MASWSSHTLWELDGTFLQCRYTGAEWIVVDRRQPEIRLKAAFELPLAKRFAERLAEERPSVRKKAGLQG